MKIKSFYDLETSTYTYVVYDEVSLDAVIIDPVLDFDQASGVVSHKSAKIVLDFIKTEALNVYYILETHAHADHLSASQYLKKSLLKPKIGIGINIKIVQETFLEVFNLPKSELTNKDFDVFFNDNEELNAGTMKISVLATPGHTPACCSYLIGNALFTGDTLFMPDSGTGRCDFPRGSAKDLFYSVQKIYTLPDETQIYVGHDYMPNGREKMYQTTIRESKKSNIHITAKTEMDEFIKLREARDSTLKAPRLLLPSLQINIFAGHLPLPEINGRSYLKLPLHVPASE